MTFQIFQLQEAKKKGVKKGVFCDYIVQVRSRKDGKPVSQKAAEHIKKVAKAQASVEARATPRFSRGGEREPESLCRGRCYPRGDWDSGSCRTRARSWLWSQTHSALHFFRKSRDPGLLTCILWGDSTCAAARGQAAGARAGARRA